jgi:hypothetical protein
MIITFEGRDWDFRDDKIGIQQAMAMHLEHGLTLRAWQEGITDLDPRAIQCSYWLMLQQNGEIRPLRGLDFEAIEFMAAYIAALQAEREKEAAEPDPTQDGSPPEGIPTPTSPGSSMSRSAKSATTTSSPSPASADSGPLT